MLDIFGISQLDIENLETYLHESSNCEYTENVLNYITGFVQRKISSNERCMQCRQFLCFTQTHVLPLIQLKDRGGLVKPSSDLCYIVRLSNVILNEYMNCCNIFIEKNLIEKISIKVVRFLEVKKPTFLNFLDSHSNVLSYQGSHKNLFIKKVVAYYLCVKLHHLAKSKNQELKGNALRHKLNKLVLFKNQ